MANVSAASESAVVNRLISHIRHEGLAPGDRLPSIRQLAAMLEVPSHIVRDALLHAQALGLVKIHPRTGAFVQALDSAPAVDVLEDMLGAALDHPQGEYNLFDLIDARRLIEVELAGEAAARRRAEALLPLK